MGSGAVRKPHHRRQFRDIRNVLNALQSRRDDMFIAADTPSALSPVGTICVDTAQVGNRYTVRTELKRVVHRFSINIASLRD